MSAYLTQLLVEPEHACVHLVNVVRQTFTFGNIDVELPLQQAHHGHGGKLCSFMTGPARSEAANITRYCHGMDLCL